MFSRTLFRFIGEFSNITSINPTSSQMENLQSNGNIGLITTPMTVKVE